MTDQKIKILWGPINTILRGNAPSSDALPEQNFSFADIKDIVGLAGITVFEDESWDDLLSEIYKKFLKMSEPEQKRCLLILTEEILKRKPELETPLRGYFNRLGWTIHEKNIIPLEVFDPSELPELPEEAHQDLIKAALRFRDGDLSGAISAACGAVDSVTKKIYIEKELGDYLNSSFQERVSKSLNAGGIIPSLVDELHDLGWTDNDSNQFKNNLTQSLNQSSYVMQNLRSKMGDVHGTKPVLKPLVFDSIKWATLIIRMLNKST